MDLCDLVWSVGVGLLWLFRLLRYAGITGWFVVLWFCGAQLIRFVVACRRFFWVILLFDIVLIGLVLQLIVLL